MVTKLQQRLMKEVLIKAYQMKPETISWPVYFVPFAPINIRDHAKLVRSMHELPHIPWPDESCIILAEDPSAEILDHGVKIMVGLFHDNSEVQRFENMPRVESIGDIEPLNFICSFKMAGSNTVHIMTKKCVMMYRMGVQWGDDKEESMDRQMARIKSGAPYSDISPEQEERIREYVWYGSPFGLDNFWHAKNWNDKTESFDEEVGFATDVFNYLINLISPCHYVVKSKFKNGFGTRAMRRATRDKPIFSLIPFQRVYREVQSPGGNGEPKSPHFRRGHVRHLWKEAGINRFRLPESPIERIKLIAQKRVRRIYVSPAWVGNRFFADEGMDYEMVVDEWELPMLKQF